MKKDYTDPLTIQELKEEYKNKKFNITNQSHEELMEQGYIHYENCITDKSELTKVYDFLMKEEFYKQVIFTKIDNEIEVYAKK